ncbi:zinc-binding dehydrogenase [Bacillus sp. MRMR6]|uniref:zinc-dependent alcohol dehydrogenase n=1 Tax=Bacillus sp. MRMR6 TaxID=1928617 RepID=UPI000950D9B4|nr:zinc-binding dehydrogenase [Bacillus sp. MRMR6]OLS33585.1 hypothetical protein BTR25_25150 [Bacillus sp. MRMR6]
MNCRVCDLTVGQSVVIFGLGAIGAIAAEILKSLGAGKVIGLDLNPNRLESAAKLKIDKVVNRQSPDWEAQIRKEIGSHGADIVIEASGSPRALADAFEIARTGAHIVVGSVYHDSANNFNLSPIMRKELKFFGAKGSYPYNSSN